MGCKVTADCVCGLEQYVLDVIAENGGGGGGGTCNLTTGDKGDITVNTLTSWSIDNGVVSYPKIQNVNTDKLLGRVSNGAGVVEEITFTDVAQQLLTQNTISSIRTYLNLGTSATTNVDYFALASHTHNAGDIVGGTFGPNLVVTTSITNNSVTNPKLADMGPYTIKGNNTALTADPLDLTGTQVTAMLDVFASTLNGLTPASGGGTVNYLRADGTWAAPPGDGSIADGDKGDITVSSSGAVWTVDSQAITYSKIQNVSATDRILGRSSAGAGQVQEIPCTSFARSILDDGSATAVHATLDLNTYYSQVGHTHAAADTISGVFNTARLGTGTANNTTYLRGDGTWSTVTVNANPAGSDSQVQFNDNGAFGASDTFVFDDFNPSALSYGKRLTLGTATTHGSLKIVGPTQAGNVSSNTWSPAQIELVVSWNTGLTSPAAPLTITATDTTSPAATEYISCSSGTGNFSVRKNGLTIADAGLRVSTTPGLGYQWGTGTGLFYEAANHIGMRNGSSAQKFAVYNQSSSNTALSNIYGTISSSAVGTNYERAVIDWQGEPGILRIGTEKGSTGTARPMKLITDGTERIEIAATGAIQFNNAYTFPTAAGVSGQSLVSDGSGNLSFQTVVSGKVTTSSATSITLAASNNGGVLKCTSGSQVFVTIPTGLPTDFTLRIVQDGAGGVNIAGASGVTVKSRVGSDSAGQYAVMWITCLASNEFVLSGDLTP